MSVRRFASRPGTGLFDVLSSGDSSTHQEFDDRRDALAWAAYLRKNWRDTGAYRVRVVDRLNRRVVGAWNRDGNSDRWDDATKWAVYR